MPRPLLGSTLAVLLTQGCATFSPEPLETVQFRERAQAQSSGGLTVSTVVPTRDEATAIYGVDLARYGMQPVWVEVVNEEDLPYWLLPSGLDPAYFSAAEAAYPFQSQASGDKRQAIRQHFDRLQFENPVPAGSTVSGFLIVNRDEGFKAVDLDLIARESARSFTYIIVDPSFRGDYTRVDFSTLYDPSEIENIEDEDALRRALEDLPCCTTNKQGTESGDPLNLVLIGNANDIFGALVRRGWHGTELITWDAIWRTVRSFVEGSRYRYSPVSALYVFGRPQDLAGQKARGTIHERNHMRIWLTPLRFRGQSVWIGQISRDIGVKFTTKSPTISTHVIDPSVDEARRYLVEDLTYSQGLARLAFVKGVGKVERHDPRYNLVGDPYYTDGLRAVMFFEPRPRTLADLDRYDWETPPYGYASPGDRESE